MGKRKGGASVPPAEAPLALVDRTGGRPCVVAVNGAARARGLVPGATATEARLRVPGIALLADDPDDPAIPFWARGFRQFAERTGSDLKALAACITAARTPLKPDDLRRLDELPVLIVVGEEDTIAGGTDEVTALLPHAMLKILPRRNHMNAVGDAAYKRAVESFLRSHEDNCREGAGEVDRNVRKSGLVSPGGLEPPTN